MEYNSRIIYPTEQVAAAAAKVIKIEKCYKNHDVEIIEDFDEWSDNPTQLYGFRLVPSGKNKDIFHFQEPISKDLFEINENEYIDDDGEIFEPVSSKIPSMIFEYMEAAKNSEPTADERRSSRDKVYVTGVGEFNSCYKAFLELGIPTSRVVDFRRKLKTKRCATFAWGDGNFYEFKIIEKRK